MSESITGYIDHIIFRNEDNGYTVMVLKGGSEEDELTCVGSFPVVTQGASVELEGNFTQHPVYGKQFQAVRLTEKMPVASATNLSIEPSSIASAIASFTALRSASYPFATPIADPSVSYGTSHTISRSG